MTEKSFVRSKAPIHKPLAVGPLGVHMVSDEGAMVLCFMQ